MSTLILTGTETRSMSIRTRTGNPISPVTIPNMNMNMTVVTA